MSDMQAQADGIAHPDEKAVTTATAPPKDKEGGASPDLVTKARQSLSDLFTIVGFLLHSFYLDFTEQEMSWRGVVSDMADLQDCV